MILKIKSQTKSLFKVLFSVFLSLLIILPPCNLRPHFNLAPENETHAVSPKVAEWVSLISMVGPIALILAFQVPVIVGKIKHELQKSSKYFVGTGLSNDPYKVTRELEEKLEHLKGQEPAVEILKDVALSTILGPPLGEKGCSVILLNGGPGVGKSAAAKGFAEAITLGVEPLMIHASSISEKDKRSVASQLLHPVETLTNDYKKRTEFVSYLETHNRPVIIINDIDKIPDKKFPDFCEMLRGIFDEGVIRDSGEQISLKGGMVILTSNIDPPCLNIKSEKVEKSNSAFLKQVNIEPTLLTRINVIQFQDLSVEVIEQLVQIGQEEILKRFKEKFGVKEINYNFEKSSLAKSIKKLNRGARGAQDTLQKMQTEILKHCMKREKESLKGQTLNVEFDETNESFTVSCDLEEEKEGLKAS